MGKRDNRYCKIAYRAISKFLAPLGISAKQDNLFLAKLPAGKITYTLEYDTADKYFIPFVESIAADLDYKHIFIVSLLHEVGHLFTFDEISDEWAVMSEL